MEVPKQTSPANTSDEDNNSNVDSQSCAVLDEYYVIHEPETPNDCHSETTVDSRNEKELPSLSDASDDINSPSQVDGKISPKSGDTRQAVYQETKKTQSIICPRVNCREKIIICLDLNKEMGSTIFRSRAGDKYSGFELAKRAIKMFVMHKAEMSVKHEFAFLIFHEESAMIHSFTSRPEDILNTLDESELETQNSGPFNLSHFFQTIQENIDLPDVKGDPQVIPPPFIVRIILIFGRSHCVPVVPNTKVQRELESSPHFFTDVLYIHEPPSAENKCEEIFSVLCDLDHNDMSYIFEQSKYTPILNSGAKLLAHPLQRPRQSEAFYKIGGPVPNPLSLPTE